MALDMAREDTWVAMLLGPFKGVGAEIHNVRQC